MLSPRTPPGARVVRVEPQPDWRDLVRPGHHARVYDMLREGREFLEPPAGGTVGAILPEVASATGFVVQLAEHEGLWSTACYRPADLPGVLTDILVGARQPEDANT